MKKSAWPNGKPGSKTGPKRTWSGPWNRLANAAGGIDELASLLYTTRRQLTRWALHEMQRGPSHAVVALVNQTSKALGVRSPCETSVEDRTGVLFPLESSRTLKPRFAAAVKERTKSAARSARGAKRRSPSAPSLKREPSTIKRSAARKTSK
jgi:hypothetical protein